jgi:hypothetical protein
MRSHFFLRKWIKLAPAHSLPLRHTWLAVDGSRVFSSNSSPPVEPHKTPSVTQPPESFSNETNPVFDEEQDKANPKLRRTRITSSPSNAKDPERLELPDEIDILWLPNESDVASLSEKAAVPPPEILQEALDSLLITLHPKIQHRAVHPSGSSSRTVEPTLGLYCPYEGGDYVVDATVRELASQTGSEVLVLDAVQLAAGEWGAFGKGILFISQFKYRRTINASSCQCLGSTHESTIFFFAATSRDGT